MARARRGRREPGDRRDGNDGGTGTRGDLTPMVDVVFLLLIFFLCATEFRDPEGTLRSWLPRERGTTPTREATIEEPCRIVLDRAGERILCRADDAAIGPSPGEPVDAVARDRAAFEARHGLRGPDFAAVERHIAARRETYRGASARGLPVVIDFGGEVPSRYVVDVVNICARLGIADVALAAPERDLE